MSEKTTVNVGGTGWLGLLGIIFVLCKIFEFGPIAAWSWWLVLLPFYAGLAIIFGVIAFTALAGGSVLGIAVLMDMWDRRQRRIAHEKAQVWNALSKKND